MILNVYVYRDAVADFYGSPIFVPSDKKTWVETITRSAILKKIDNLDCECYWLGTYDDNRACFELNEKPEFLIDLRQFKPKEEAAK